MPFTISHTILAPPLAKLSGQRLPIAALAIGCMTPDLFRLFTNAESYVSHEWAGIIFPNLIIGLFFCVLWYLIYRPTVYRWWSMHDPLNIHSLNDLCGFIIACIFGVIVGTASHILLDGLTHDDFRTWAFQGFLSGQVSIASQVYPMHRVVQLTVSVLFLPVIYWMCLRYYKKYKIQDLASSQFNYYYASLSFLVSLVFGLFFASWIFADLSLNDYLAQMYSLTGKSLNYFARGFLLSFTGFCLIYLFIFKKRNSTHFSDLDQES